jgi:hypothetical protein
MCDATGGDERRAPTSDAHGADARRAPMFDAWATQARADVRRDGRR